MAVRWIVRGALLFLLTFANVHDIWSPDVVPNTLMAWSLIRSRTVDFDAFVTPETIVNGPAVVRIPGPSPEIPRDSYFFRACGPARSESPQTPVATPGPSQSSPRSPGGPPAPGPNDHVCSVFPPGISILALPVLAPFVILGASPADGTLVIRAGHLAAALIETLAALLLWSVLLRFTSTRWALGLVLLYWLGTSVRTIASQALWQHAGVHLAIALSLWIVLHDRPISLARELAGGIVLGLGVVVRQTTALIAIGISGAGHRRLGWPHVSAQRFRASLVFLAGVVIGALPLALYDQIAFGSPFEQGYGLKPFITPPLEGLYGLLLSPSRGLFVYEPWTLAALASFVLAWRRSGPVTERLRTLSITWVLFLIGYALYAEWWGGRVFGPRFLDDFAPVLIVALGWGISQGPLTPTWARIAFFAAAGWSLLLFNAAALVYDPNGWDTVPTNVNFDPSRLFSWGDPQWLNVLTSFGSADLRVLLAAVLSSLVLALLLRLEVRAG